MKDRTLRIYLERTSDMGTVKRLDRTISLLEEFTGWTFVLDEYLTGHWRMGILPTDISLGNPYHHQKWMNLCAGCNDIFIKAGVEFSDTWPSLEPIPNILDKWCSWAQYTLGETTTSIRMKLQLRGITHP